jgi:hypothetical protein
MRKFRQSGKHTRRRCANFFLSAEACPQGLTRFGEEFNIQHTETMEPPSKKMRKLLDDDSSDSGDDAGGVSLGKSPESGFKVNAEYAKRFEYNKKREEVAKCKVTDGFCFVFIILVYSNVLINRFLI